MTKQKKSGLGNDPFGGMKPRGVDALIRDSRKDEQKAAVADETLKQGLRELREAMVKEIRKAGLVPDPKAEKQKAGRSVKMTVSLPEDVYRSWKTFEFNRAMEGNRISFQKYAEALIRKDLKRKSKKDEQ